MKNIIGKFVVIQRSLPSCLAAQSFVAFYVSGIVGRKNIIVSRKSGINENRLFQDREM